MACIRHGASILLVALALLGCGVGEQQQELARQGRAWIGLLAAGEWDSAAERFVYGEELTPERVAEMLAIVVRELGSPVNSRFVPRYGPMWYLTITTKQTGVIEVHSDIPFLADFGDIRDGLIMIRFEGFLGSPEIEAVTFGLPMESSEGKERIQRAIEAIK